MSTHSAKDTFVFLKVPAEQYDLIINTLETDARSSNFDRSLREDISKAIESIEVWELPASPSKHFFIFKSNGVIASITDEHATKITVNVHIIDYDKSLSGECPVCSNHLEPFEAGCRVCGLDTDADTYENTIAAYFKSQETHGQK